MIALVQLLIKYAFLEPFGASTSLDFKGITLLILATSLIAAAGNVINDILDVETDAINKPKKVIVGKTISENTAYNIFITLNVIGVIAGYILSSMEGNTSLFAIFIVISIILYIYATYLKRTMLLGNIVISFLVALSLILVGVFELIPALNNQNKNTQCFFLKIILDYSIFAFLLNLLREIAKDIQDIDGDYKAGMRTLPISIGRNRAKNVFIALSFIPLIGCIFYVMDNWYSNLIGASYFIILVIGPLLYVIIKAFTAKSKKDYAYISGLLKLIMLFGMLSLLLYKYVIL